MADIYKKSKLTVKGYVIPKNILSDELINDMIKELTIIPITIPGYSSNNNNDDGRFYLYQHSSNNFYVPRYYGIIKFGLPLINKLSDGINIDCKFEGILRDYQKNVINSWKKSIKKTGGGSIIAIKPGGGKTIISIATISEMKLKTIILVHNSDLLNQWIERLETFLPSAKIGVIKGKICNTSNKDVVIGSIQSISDIRKDNEYSSELFNEFGMLIIDECHHIGAKSFSRCLKKIQPKYIIGLSATPQRDDGLTKVIKYYIGDICFDDTDIKKTEIEKSLDHIPDANVILYKYKSNNLKYCKTVLNFKKKPNNAQMITNISNYKNRNEFILSLLPDLIKEDRNILIITERRDHVFYFIENIIEQNISSCGVYVGSMKKDILKESKKKQILVGTYKMISEGFDCEKLDTLILATPKKKLRQVVGRIQRTEKQFRNKTPLIIDIIDEFSIYNNWFRLRNLFYNYSNFKKYEYNVIDEESNKITYICEYDFPVPQKERKKNPYLNKGKTINKMIKVEKNKKPNVIYDDGLDL